MAFRVLSSPFLVSMPSQKSMGNHIPSTHSVFKSVRCVIGTQSTDQTVIRRSANYAPTSWDYDFVQSLSSDYSAEKYVRWANKMKEDVRCLINGVIHPLERLELIDRVQRLGLKHHFEKEIKNGIDILYYGEGNVAWLCDDSDLHAMALRFRILRQHGYPVSQGVFETFKDHNGKFKAWVCEDVKGLLSLYEASFFGLEGEEKLDEAKTFSKEHLIQLLIKGDMPQSMVKNVEHALEMPLHWRMTRSKARWFINTYKNEHDIDSTLLQLAKLDYNMVQATHRREAAKLARWWVDLGLDKLTFTRDRLVEHYMWCSGMVYSPQFESSRYMLTKIICLVTVIDDCYDIYDKLDELEIFTDFVDRWDITQIDDLPQCLKICLLAMYNTSNDIGYWIMRERGVNIIPYLRKEWADLCKSYLKEATWYNKGYKPTLDEYLDNAVISIAVPIMLFTCYLLTTENITKEALEYIYKLPMIMRCTSVLVRLTNDLGTSSDELARGDNMKSIQCYMHESGATEKDAREHISGLVHETWKTMNKVMFDKYPFSEPFISACTNLGRTGHFFYEFGDGHGNPDHKAKDRLMKLLVEPISLT